MWYLMLGSVLPLFREHPILLLSEDGADDDFEYNIKDLVNIATAGALRLLVGNPVANFFAKSVPFV